MSIRQLGVKSHPKNTPIFVRGRSIPIGFVRNGVFYKSIQGSKHLLRSPRAIAFDSSTIDDAAQAQAVTVHVTDDETRTVYEASIENIRRYGFKVHRGSGDQVALTLNHWEIDGAPATALPKSKKAVQTAQLSLFAEVGA